MLKSPTRLECYIQLIRVHHRVLWMPIYKKRTHPSSPSPPTSSLCACRASALKARAELLLTCWGPEAGAAGALPPCPCPPRAAASATAPPAGWLPTAEPWLGAVPPPLEPTPVLLLWSEPSPRLLLLGWPGVAAWVGVGGGGLAVEGGTCCDLTWTDMTIDSSPSLGLETLAAWWSEKESACVYRSAGASDVTHVCGHCH
jgi:hypothetical protein